MLARTTTRRAVGMPALALAAMVVGFLAGCSDPARTPKEIAKAWAAAVESGDTDAARAVASGSEQQLQILDGAVLVAGAMKRLDKAVIDRWGDEARKVAPGGTGQEADQKAGVPAEADLAAAIDAAEESVTSETATLTLKGGSGPGLKAGLVSKELKLKKVDGKWRIDLAALFGDAPESARADVENELAQAKKLRAAIDEVTRKVEAGEYENADQAFAASFGALFTLEE